MIPRLVTKNNAEPEQRVGQKYRDITPTGSIQNLFFVTFPIFVTNHGFRALSGLEMRPPRQAAAQAERSLPGFTKLTRKGRHSLQHYYHVLLIGTKSE